jgi:hypothetical protein
MSKHASLHILTSKMQKEIRLRYKQEIDEMIEDEVRYQMIMLAEADTNNLNKLAAEKQVQKIIKKRMTLFLSEAHPD